ncbi:MAG TPA: hypothetical protein PKE41_11735 [Candidatus Macondimonas sp.]|jgi:hypothetical protein|nr:hypothetical protein [Candidatus Macondimonas sp.]
MTGKRCGNCRHLDPSSAGDIGGLRIARCRRPKGTRIGATFIRNHYVELNAHCANHEARAWRGVMTGGAHV